MIVPHWSTAMLWMCLFSEVKQGGNKQSVLGWGVYCAILSKQLNLFLSPWVEETRWLLLPMARFLAETPNKERHLHLFAVLRSGMAASGNTCVTFLPSVYKVGSPAHSMRVPPRSPILGQEGREQSHGLPTNVEEQP